MVRYQTNKPPPTEEGCGMSESTESRPTSAPGVAVLNADEKRLHELGYAQELHRGMGWFSNFAVSFTIISILSGGITTYYLGMVAGGPRVIIWGWLFVGGMVMLVGAGMAEVCSSFRPQAVFITGQRSWRRTVRPRCGVGSPAGSTCSDRFAVTASIDFAMATFCGFFLNLTTGFQGTAKSLFGIYTLVLIAHGILNSLGVNIIAKLNNISVWWHLTASSSLSAVVHPPRRAQAPVNLERLHQVLRRSRLGLRWPCDLGRSRRAHDGAVHVDRLRRVRSHDRRNP